uniref:Uncharacterized protein n=1 Tax=Chromera velia CCMP2878 TaxID=1169474 RepID=A0A0G4H864_9ALVE|eukprot:Cvel_5867.t1-p1 / transcript=Cvel_5867.t1 / gene=Cvel_5867 / organism=Chromera_velia_CCMP2878 / gene_product=hypothetical protein / transcript_product=hypothetical protein / location=Cvel_scaffold279:42318-48833(-) / protein_length=700 / sequence_SO=supercontig / SO=protein_coding / is_pseudo=false
MRGQTRERREKGSRRLRRWPQPISRIALGFRHALIVAGGRVMTFGKKDLLGFFVTCARKEPTEIPGVSGVVDACAGRTHSVVLLESGRVLSWHDVEEAGVTFKTPSAILPLGAEGESDGDWGGGKVVGVTCGDGFSAVWTDGGRLYLWSADVRIVLTKHLELPARLPCLSPEYTKTKKKEELFRPMPVPPSVFQNQKVKAAFAGASRFGNQLLVVTEDRNKIYLCEENKSECASFGLPEDMHIPSENASAAFGSDFFLIVLQNQTDSLRQLYAGSVPPPGNPEAGLSLHAIAVGEGRTNVTEVTSGERFGLARLQNNDIVVAGRDPTVYETAHGDRSLKPDSLETQKYKNLNGKVLQLPKSFYFSGGSIFLTVDGLEGIGWPQWTVALFPHYQPFSFHKVQSPVLAPGGCEVPIEWRGNQTKTKSSDALPVRILQYESAGYPREWVDFPPEGTGVSLNHRIRLGCRGLISIEEVMCVEPERAGAVAKLTHSPSNVFRSPQATRSPCLPAAGCVAPSLWTNKEPLSPSLPFSLELKRGDDPNGTFTKYDKDTPAGAGELLRLGCRGVLGASSDGDLRRAAEGIECRLKEEDGVRGIDWEIPSENSTAVTCTGCVVPAAWIPTANSERLRYYVDVKGVVEAGSKKRKALDKTKGIGPVGVNDTIVFSCPNGGVPTRKRARCVVGGDGSPLFDAEVADVQCGE